MIRKIIISLCFTSDDILSQQVSQINIFSNILILKVAASNKIKHNHMYITVYISYFEEYWWSPYLYLQIPTL
jgi:hypothetical protein